MLKLILKSSAAPSISSHFTFFARCFHTRDEIRFYWPLNIFIMDGCSRYALMNLFKYLVSSILFFISFSQAFFFHVLYFCFPLLKSPFFGLVLVEKIVDLLGSCTFYIFPLMLVCKVVFFTSLRI